MFSFGINDTAVDAKSQRVALSAGYDRIVGKAGWSTSVAFTRSSQHQFRGFLVTLDPEAVKGWAQENGVEGDLAAISGSEELRADVQRGLDVANQDLARVEQVKRFAILPADWEPGGDELTPTMKLKRRPIAEKYADEIESLYDA